MVEPTSQSVSQSAAQPAARPAGQPAAQPAGQPAAQPSSADVEKLVNRLKRIEGQVRGLQRMVAGNAQCEDVLTQLAATRAALDRVGIFVITHKIRECLADEGETSSEVAVQRALEIFQKYAQHLRTAPDADRP